MALRMLERSHVSDLDCRCIRLVVFSSCFLIDHAHAVWSSSVREQMDESRGVGAQCLNTH